MWNIISIFHPNRRTTIQVWRQSGWSVCLSCLGCKNSNVYSVLPGRQTCLSSSQFLLPAVRPAGLHKAHRGAKCFPSPPSPHTPNFTRHTAGERLPTAHTCADILSPAGQFQTSFSSSEGGERRPLQFCCCCSAQKNSGIFKVKSWLNLFLVAARNKY